MHRLIVAVSPLPLPNDASNRRVNVIEAPLPTWIDCSGVAESGVLLRRIDVHQVCRSG